MIQLTLPYPPSVNRMYRNVGGKTLLSKDGRDYRESVGIACLIAGRPRIEGRIAVSVELCPPDRRRRDLDNAFKGLLDSLQHAGVYEDDSQIDDLRIRRGAVVSGGEVKVVLEAVQ